MQIGKKFNLNSDLIERDFEYLHEVILEQTKTDLSTSTLRRIWSSKYQSIPQTKTLDALAQVLGHSGWHAYKQAQQSVGLSFFQKNARSIAYGVGVLFVVVSIVLLTSTDEAIGEVSLSPEVQTYEGVPATIGFRYEIKNPNIDIELSWNPYERTRLEVNKDFYTGTYFYPDYHKAKLVYEELVLASTPVHVTTASWHGLVMDAGYDTRPAYLNAEEYILEGRLTVDHETLLATVEESEIALPVFTLSHKDLSNLSGDDFTLSATVKSEWYQKQPCGIYELLIKGEKGNIRIPVSQNGCYGLTDLRCVNKVVSGKQHDLSALSTELSRDHQVKVQLKEKEMILNVADNPTLTINYEGEIGPLKVIKFIFQGPSEVSSFELLNEGGIRLESKALYPF